MGTDDNLDVTEPGGESQGSEAPPPGLDDSSADSALEAELARINKEHGVDAEAETEPEPKPAKEPEKPKDAKAKEKEAPVEEAAKEPDTIAVARSALAKRERALIDKTAEFRTRESQWQAQHEQQSKRLEQLHQQAQTLIDESGRDPLAWLERVHGIRREDLGRRILHDGQAAPEEISARAEREARAAREEAAAYRRELTEHRQRETFEATKAREETRFVSEAREEGTYPTLGRVYENDAELLEEAYAMGQRLMARHQRKPSNDEILSALEEREKKRYTKVTSQGPESGSSHQGKQAAGSPENGRGHQGTKAEAPAGPTLTNRTAAERASMATFDPDEDPQEERKRLIAIANKAAGASA